MNKKQQIFYVTRCSELIFPIFKEKSYNSNIGSFRLGLKLAKILLRQDFDPDDWEASKAASKAFDEAYFAYGNDAAYSLVGRSNEEWALREAEAIRHVYALHASKAACQAYIVCQLDETHRDCRTDIVYSAIIRAVQLTRSKGRVRWKQILQLGINILKGEV